MSRGQEQVGHIVADGAHEKDLAERLPDAPRRDRQRSRVVDEGLLSVREALGVCRGGGERGVLICCLS